MVNLSRRVLLGLMVVAVGIVMSPAGSVQGATQQVDVFWGAGCGAEWGDGSPAIFGLDTATGTVGAVHVYEDWSWVLGLAYGDGKLYASYNTVADGYTVNIAKINPSTGEVLSSTPMYTLTGTDYPQPNTLHYKDGKLYCIENNGWGSGYTASAMRGYVYEIVLDAAGDPVSATTGAYVGDAPDGALTFKDGVWYASDWLSGTSSSIVTSSDIMNTDFVSVGATQGVGYFSGWDSDASGDVLGVSWYDGDFNVYDIDLADGTLTALYDIQSQLPSSVEQLTAMTSTPMTASTDTIIVPDDYATIQAAVFAADPYGGDTVYVRDGLYTESNILVDRPVTITGQSESGVVVAPAAEDTGDRLQSFDGNYQHGFMVTADNVVIRTLTIDGAANNVAQGGTLPDHHNYRIGILNYADGDNGYDGLTVNNVTIQNVLRRGISIWPAETGGHFVSGCTIRRVEHQQAISCSGAPVTITGNTISEVGSGIALFPSLPAGSGLEMTVSYNTIYDVAGQYSQYYGHSWPSNAIYYRNPNVDQTINFIGNDITIGAGSEDPCMPGVLGMYVYNADENSVVSGNTIDSTGGENNWGIYLGGCAGTTVEDNTFLMNDSDSGIYLGRGAASDPVPNVIRNSVFSSTGSTSSDVSQGCALVQGDHGDLFWMVENPYVTENVITGNEISGFVTGILLHSEGLYDVRASINENHITSCGAYAIDAGTLPDPCVIEASANYFGVTNGTDVAAVVSDHVDYTPWLGDGTDADPNADGFQAGYDELYVAQIAAQQGPDGPITEAIGLVEDYGSVHVCAGTYAEELLIQRPMTLLGATAGVNKNGYPVPTDYAWDDTVETIINHPDPNNGYGWIVNIEDTDDVTFDGFVVQELNATANKNTSLVKVHADTREISTIQVVNNVIGPNTKLGGQDGTHGRMGLYLVNRPYHDHGIVNSSIAHNKLFDCKGNGNNVFLWSSYYAYGAPGPASMAGTVIEDNEISGSHRSGIETAGGFTDLVIRDNVIFDNCELPGDDPNKLKYGHGILLIRGSSDKMSDPMTAYGPTDLTIEGNVIYDNSKSGIYMGPRNQNVSITNNVIQRNGWDGVMLDLQGNYWNAQFEPDPGSAYACYDCSTGVAVLGNSIAGNGTAGNPNACHGVQIVGEPSNEFTINAANNWWGSADGPLDAIGTTEVAAGDCGYVPLWQSLNVAPTGSLGDAVSEDVDYCPWLTDSGVSLTNLAIEQDGVDVLGCAANALQGAVTISVDASGFADGTAGLDGEPVVIVTQGATLPTSYIGESPAGTFNYEVFVDATTLNGTWTVDVTAYDLAGEAIGPLVETFCVNKNRITGQVELDYFAGSSRSVTFSASDGSTTVQSWSQDLTFSGGVGNYVLDDVDGSATSLSAKTASSLRQTLPVTLDADGQATVDFLSGDDYLPGGDLDDDNVVNAIDFLLFQKHWLGSDPLCDLDGVDGVEINDLLILVSNWLDSGDAE